MIRFAKVLEIDDHQFLVRLCHHRALAGLPYDAADTTPCTLLTIDAVLPCEEEPHHLMRMIINCQVPVLQRRCFEAVNELHCLEALETLNRQRMGQLNRHEMMEATQRLQASLLSQVINS